MHNPKQQAQTYTMSIIRKHETKEYPVLHREFESIKELSDYLQFFNGFGCRIVIESRDNTTTLQDIIFLNVSFNIHDNDNQYTVDAFTNVQSTVDLLNKLANAGLRSKMEIKKLSTQSMEQYMRIENYITHMNKNENPINKFNFDINTNLKLPLLSAFESLKWLEIKDNKVKIKEQSSKHKKGKGEAKYYDIKKLLEMLDSNNLLERFMHYSKLLKMNYHDAYLLVEKEILEQVNKVIKSSNAFASVTSSVSEKITGVLVINGMLGILHDIRSENHKTANKENVQLKQLK